MKNTTFCVLRFFRLFGTKVLGLMGMGIIVLASSCSKNPQSPGYEYMPNMYRSPSYETYSTNPVFADGNKATSVSCPRKNEIDPGRLDLQLHGAARPFHIAPNPHPC